MKLWLHFVVSNKEEYKFLTEAVRPYNLAGSAMRTYALVSDERWRDPVTGEAMLKMPAHQITEMPDPETGLYKKRHAVILEEEPKYPTIHGAIELGRAYMEKFGMLEAREWNGALVALVYRPSTQEGGMERTFVFERDGSLTARPSPWAWADAYAMGPIHDVKKDK